MKRAIFYIFVFTAISFAGNSSLNGTFSDLSQIDTSKIKNILNSEKFIHGKQYIIYGPNVYDSSTENVFSDGDSEGYLYSVEYLLSRVRNLLNDNAYVKFAFFFSTDRTFVNCYGETVEDSRKMKVRCVKKKANVLDKRKIENKNIALPDISQILNSIKEKSKFSN